MSAGHLGLAAPATLATERPATHAETNVARTSRIIRFAQLSTTRGAHFRQAVSSPEDGSETMTMDFVRAGYPTTAIDGPMDWGRVLEARRKDSRAPVVADRKGSHEPTPPVRHPRFAVVESVCSRDLPDLRGLCRLDPMGRLRSRRGGASGIPCRLRYRRIRVLNADGRPGREEILEAVPDTRVVYRVIQGLPVSDHRAEVTLSPREDARTEVTWTAHFTARRWLGSLLWLALTVLLWRTLRRLEMETRRRASC